MGVDFHLISHNWYSGQEFRHRKNFFATFALPPSNAPPSRVIFLHHDIESVRDVFARMAKNQWTDLTAQIDYHWRCSNSYKMSDE